MRVITACVASTATNKRPNSSLCRGRAHSLQDHKVNSVTTLLMIFLVSVRVVLCEFDQTVNAEHYSDVSQASEEEHSVQTT